MKTRNSFAAAAALFFAASTPASAQTCEQNFTVEGTPLVTAVNFRTSQNFPGLDQRKAFASLRSGMLAEGFSNIQADRAGGALTALQETSGSGRPQTLRVTARKAGGGTRVDAVFMVQIGQTANPGIVRASLCRVVSSARL